MEEIRTRRVLVADVDRAVRTLAAAFDQDPFINWLIRQDDRRGSGFDTLFCTCLTSLCLRHGEALITADHLGTALWYPPGKAKVGIGRQLVLLPAMIRAAGIRGLGRLVRVMTLLESIHPRQRHYYLQFIGVNPEHQGSGIGSALLQPVLERCDRERCGAYLENTNAGNRTFYEKRGFTVVRELKLATGAPPLWPMWRDPVGVSDPSTL